TRPQPLTPAGGPPPRTAAMTILFLRTGAPGLGCEFLCDDEALVLRLVGRADEPELPTLLRYLGFAAGQRRPTVVFDLARLESIAPPAVEAIAELAMAVMRAGGRVRVM